MIHIYKQESFGTPSCIIVIISSPCAWWDALIFSLQAATATGGKIIRREMKMPMTIPMMIYAELGSSFCFSASAQLKYQIKQLRKKAGRDDIVIMST